MPVPHPEPGLVISYSYLWRYEHTEGKNEGRKARPCVIVLAIEERKKDTLVTVAPITHSRPGKTTLAIELTSKIKRHIGLDDGQSWIILNEVNQFAWPGFDLQPVPHDKSRFDYGFLPPRLLEKIKTEILDLIVERRARITNRD
jgi:uncharacterized protein YifN (PemK superfamily)